MPALRCKECGLINFETAEVCKRCGLSLQGGAYQPNPGSAPYESQSPYTPGPVAKKRTSPVASVGGLLGFATTYGLMSLLSVETRFMIYGGLAVGIVAGLIPFFVAKSRGQKKLAGVSLLICAISGVVLGLLLAVPAAIVLTVVALRQKPVLGN